MKKIISILALAAAFTTAAFAQEDGNRDAEGNIVRGPYVTNGFWDNTFIQLQGGVNLMGANHMGQGNGAKSIVPALGLEVDLGKWFNPNFGLRLGWQGLNTAYYPGSTKIKEKNFFSYTHADFLVNVSNWASGYKQTRVWDFVPYLHAGWIYTPATGYDKALNKPGVGVGLYNKIRLTDHWGLSLDLRAILCSNSIMGTTYVKRIEEASGRETFKEKLGGVATGLVGVTYNFGETGWVRAENADKSLVAGAGAAGAAGLVLGEYIGAAKKDAKLQSLQAKADASVASSQAKYNSAVSAYETASVKVDADGNVTPAAYDVDPELASAYSDMANFEDCPDFATMTRAEKNAWTKSHKDILPAGWKKMKDAEKQAWVDETIYTPAQVAVDEKEAAAHQVAEGRQAIVAAGQDCDDALALAQWFVDDAAKRVDANGNVLPTTYPGVANAQAYADLANTEACPDFTKMSKKETRAWIKAHKDILPKEFKKLTAEQKNDWMVDNIYGPAFQAKADAEAAAEELAKAQARKALQDKNATAAAQNLDKETASDGVGYFTIGKSQFNEKQLANWKKSIKKLDKTANYTVTGYADKETGTPAINAKLRKDRSEYVANLLKENGFTGEITPVAASATEKFVNYPIWKNRSAVIK